MHYHIPLTAAIRSFGLFVSVIGLACSGRSAPAQPTQQLGSPAALKERPKEKPLLERLRSPRETDRPLAEKLRSPRDTVKTLYYAIITYDLFPVMMEEAVACLDLESLTP